MTSTAFRFKLNGAILEPHQSGALYWPDQETLIVADLHLEKAASIAAGGQFLPPYDSIETLAQLDGVITKFKPKHLIALGDSFHDRFVAHHLHPDLLHRIKCLSQSLQVTWVLGNHDPDVPAFLGGTVVEDMNLGPLHFRHEASPLFGAVGEVSGHYHPKACTLIKGRRYTKPVFVADQRRLILPAFGVFTGGLWVHDPAIYNLFSRQMQVFFCAKNRVLPVPIAQILPRI